MQYVAVDESGDSNNFTTIVIALLVGCVVFALMFDRGENEKSEAGTKDTPDATPDQGDAPRVRVDRDSDIDSIVGRTDDIPIDTAGPGHQDSFSRLQRRTERLVADLRSTVRGLESRIVELDHSLATLTEDYPTVEQLVAMRRDIDRLVTADVPLLREASLELRASLARYTARRLRVVWLNAGESMLGDTNDILLPYLDSGCDVLCLHNARMSLGRFEVDRRTIGALDFFNPVPRYRSQVMLLTIDRILGGGEALVSGMIFPANARVKFPSVAATAQIPDDSTCLQRFVHVRGVGERLRALTLRCSLADDPAQQECVIGCVYDCENGYDQAQADVEELLRLAVLAPVADRDPPKRVFMVGHTSCPVDVFRHEIAPRLANELGVRSEFDRCLDAPVITDTLSEGGFRHDVHALSSDRVVAFEALPPARVRTAAVAVTFELQGSEPLLGASLKGNSVAAKDGRGRALHVRPIL